MLRGSAVTGFRWKDKAPFDADGPGTSDLDLTFVGTGSSSTTRSRASSFPACTPGRSARTIPTSRPTSFRCANELMDMVKRPVNIQGTRDFVMYFRGELLGQPYLTLVEKSDTE